MGPETVGSLRCAARFGVPDWNWGRSDDTYSERDPRLDRERYMRAAPIDLCSSNSEPLDSGEGGRGADEQNGDGRPCDNFVPNIIQIQNKENHNWYLCKQGQRKPDYTLLIKQFPYTRCIPMRVSQEPDQDGREEHHVDHESAEGIDEAPSRMLECTGI